jgi:hypothetical protein
MHPDQVLPTYLDLLDSQRETALAIVDALTEGQVWQRFAPKEWCIGEILDHNYRLIASTMPYVRFAWRYFGWYGERKRHRPYQTHIPDLYRAGKFPMWVGFLWTPRYNPNNRAPATLLMDELRQLHQQVREFYTGKDENVLGNIKLFDPYFGWLNLILTLRLGIYHDQLHYDDVIKLANSFSTNSSYNRNKI